MKSSVAFLMCVLAGSSVVSGIKCYDYTCPTASTLTAPASSAADCVAASAATCLKSDGTTACTYAETTCGFTPAGANWKCTYAGTGDTSDTCLKSDASTACSGFIAGTSTQADCEAIVDVAAHAPTCFKADGSTACTGFTAGTSTQADCEAIVDVSAASACGAAQDAPATNCAFTAAGSNWKCTYTGTGDTSDTCLTSDGTACSPFIAGTTSQGDCELITDVASDAPTCLKSDGTTTCTGFTAGTTNQAGCELLEDAAATTCTYTAAQTATTDTCTPCKNTCATGQECFNQEGTSAGNNGGCVAAGGESGAISGGGSQSICTTDLCNDNTGTSPAFRAEFLSALVVAIFASLY